MEIGGNWSFSIFCSKKERRKQNNLFLVMLIPHAVELLLCQMAHWKYSPKRCLALIFEALSHSHLVMSVYKHIGWSFNIVSVDVGGCLSWSLWYPWPGTLPHTQQGQMSFSWITGTNKPRKNLEVPFALLKLVNISVYLRCSGTLSWHQADLGSSSGSTLSDLR